MEEADPVARTAAKESVAAFLAENTNYFDLIKSKVSGQSEDLRMEPEYRLSGRGKEVGPTVDYMEIN